MTKLFKRSATVEQFLANEMTPIEEDDFRKELTINPDLAEELWISKTIDTALMREDIIELRKKLVSAIEAGRTVSKEARVARMNSHRWLYSAASLLALFAIAAVIYLQTKRAVSADSLFEQYYSSENIVDQTRGNLNIVEAVIKFQKKDFKGASILFKNLLDKDNSNMAVWFYYGISCIETQNLDIAINAFTTIINQKDNLYIEHAEWYRGLCYLKNNQLDKAISQFEAVAANPDNFHRQDAKSILGELQR